MHPDNTNGKKEVKYDANMHVYTVEGECAFVFPFNHPNCSNREYVRTSTVQKVYKDSHCFETMNSFYIPAYSD